MKRTAPDSLPTKDPDTYSVLVFVCLFSGLHRIYLGDFLGAGLRVLGDAAGWFLVVRGGICGSVWQVGGGVLLLAALFVRSLADARCAYAQVRRAARRAGRGACARSEQ